MRQNVGVAKAPSIAASVFSYYFSNNSFSKLISKMWRMNILTQKERIVVMNSYCAWCASYRCNRTEGKSWPYHIILSQQVFINRGKSVEDVSRCRFLLLSYTSYFNAKLIPWQPTPRNNISLHEFWIAGVNSL